jgi:hypothetical protein
MKTKEQAYALKESPNELPLCDPRTTPQPNKVICNSFHRQPPYMAEFIPNTVSINTRTYKLSTAVRNLVLSLRWQLNAISSRTSISISLAASCASASHSSCSLLSMLHRCTSPNMVLTTSFNTLCNTCALRKRLWDLEGTIELA